MDFQVAGIIVCVGLTGTYQNTVSKNFVEVQFLFFNFLGYMYRGIDIFLETKTN